MFKVHPNAEVQTDKIGEGTVIWQYAVVLKGVSIGQNCNINAHTFIENDVVIGNNVTVKSGVYLWSGIIIEDDVFIGPNVTFVNDPYPRSKKYLQKPNGALIERGASIGANSTILSNILIGKYSMIGAGSVITKNIPPYSLWVGNPAKQIGFVTHSGITLDMDFVDKKTGDRYLFDRGNFILI